MFEFRDVFFEKRPSEAIHEHLQAVGHVIISKIGDPEQPLRFPQGMMSQYSQPYAVSEVNSGKVALDPMFGPALPLICQSFQFVLLISASQIVH